MQVDYKGNEIIIELDQLYLNKWTGQKSRNNLNLMENIITIGAVAVKRIIN